MKKIVILAAAALAGACGGTAGNAAASRQFDYGSPAAPTTQEQSAGSATDSSLSDTASFASSPDPTHGANILSMADSISSAALGSGAVFGRWQDPPSSNLHRAMRAAAALNTCATVSGNTITFNSCSQTESSYTVSFSGHISASTGLIDWEITGSMNGTSSTGGTVNVSLLESGHLAATASSISGQALASVNASGTSQGQTVSLGVDEAVLMDLTYQTQPTACVTSGSIEARRVWTNRPAGASAAQLPDLGAKLTWTGCDAFTVAHSK